MSETHPDADLVKVTRTTTTYEPATKQTATVSGKPRNRVLFWVIGICAVAAIAAGAIFLYEAPAPAQQHAAADQSRAQSLDQQATSSQQAAQAAQQSADQAQTQAATLAANARHDRRAAARAATTADTASKSAPKN